MKRLINIFAFCICIAVVSPVSGQYGVFDSIQVNTSTTDGGTFMTDALIYRPVDYPFVGKRWPLIIDLHGAGEAGTNLTSLIGQGLPNKINAGSQKPILKYGAYSTEAFVCFPQASSFSTDPNKIQNIIKTLFTLYPIDSTRVYLSGLSAGGNILGLIGGYSTAATYTRYNKYITAIFARSPHNGSMVYDSAKRYDIWSPAVGFVYGGQASDGAYKSFSIRAADSLDNYMPGRVFTHEVASWGHDNFILTFDTAQRYSGLGNKNFYEFLATYTNDTDSTGDTYSPAATTPPTANAGLDQTLIWPENFCTLYGGHPSFSAKSANGGPITSWVWSKISGPGTADIDKYLNYTDNATSTDSAVFIKGLSLGTHQFELTITDSAGGTDKDTVQVVVQNCTYNNSPKTITITADVYNPTTFASTYNVLPGDIVQIDASQVDSLDNFIVGNVHGCPGQPIIIKPINGMLNIGTIKFSNTGEGTGNNKSSWIHLDGSGVPGQTYGIKARQFVIGTAHHIEMNNIWSDNSGQVGIVIAPYENATPKSLDRMFPAHYMRGIYLHDFKVTRSVNEGVYIGGSTPQTFVGYSDPINARGDTVYVYNGEIDTSGQDGIQVSSFNSAWVFNNYLNRPAKNNVTGHGTGISIGSGVKGKVWNNIIRKSANQGILVSGHDSVEVWNNYLDSCSFLNQNPATFPAIIYTSFGKYTHEAWKPQKVYIHHNYIKDPWNLRDIEITDYLSLADPAKVDSNTFYLENYSSGFPGSYILLSASPGSTQAGNVQSTFSVPAWQKSTTYRPTLMNPSGLVSGGGQNLQGGSRIRIRFKIKTQ